MNLFCIEISEIADKKPKLYKLLIFGAILFMLLAGISLFTLDDDGKSAQVYALVLAIYLISYTYFAWLASKSRLYIQADEYAVKFNFSMLKRSSEIVIWDTVEKVKLGPTYIALYKRTGKRRLIRLGWLPYAKVILVKDEMYRACRYKKIPCERVEFLYSKKKKSKKDKQSI